MHISPFKELDKSDKRIADLELLTEYSGESAYEPYKGIVLDPEDNEFKTVSGMFRDKKEFYEKLTARGFVVRKVFEAEVYDWIEEHAATNLEAYLMLSTAFSKWKGNNLLNKYYVELLNDIPKINREKIKGDPNTKGGSLINKKESTELTEKKAPIYTMDDTTHKIEIIPVDEAGKELTQFKHVVKKVYGLPTNSNLTPVQKLNNTAFLQAFYDETGGTILKNEDGTMEYTQPLATFGPNKTYIANDGEEKEVKHFIIKIDDRTITDPKNDNKPYVYSRNTLRAAALNSTTNAALLNQEKGKSAHGAVNKTINDKLNKAADYLINNPGDIEAEKKYQDEWLNAEELKSLAAHLQKTYVKDRFLRDGAEKHFMDYEELRGRYEELSQDLEKASSLPKDNSEYKTLYKKYLDSDTFKSKDNLVTAIKKQLDVFWEEVNRSYFSKPFTSPNDSNEVKSAMWVNSPSGVGFTSNEITPQKFTTPQDKLGVGKGIHSFGKTNKQLYAMAKSPDKKGNITAFVHDQIAQNKERDTKELENQIDSLKKELDTAKSNHTITSLNKKIAALEKQLDDKKESIWSTAILNVLKENFSYVAEDKTVPQVGGDGNFTAAKQVNAGASVANREMPLDGVISSPGAIVYYGTILTEDEEDRFGWMHLDLNQNLFDGTVLRPEVRTALLAIAEKFKNALGLSIEPVDIYLTGSSANYNYTDSSDIDLHLVYDFEQAGINSNILTKYFIAKKQLFNNNYELSIRTIPVEVGVENVNEPIVSSGIYSVLNDQWLVQPEYEQRMLPKPNIQEYYHIVQEIEAAIQSGDSTKIGTLWDKLYELRRESLKAEGEQGKGNALFKKLRNLGYIDRLKTAYYHNASKELSLESLKEI